jgi:hypothetical protein
VLSTEVFVMCPPHRDGYPSPRAFGPAADGPSGPAGCTCTGQGSGWTVLVDGRLRVVTDPVAAERLGQLATPWLRVPRPHVLLLEAMHGSGRRLQAVGGVEVVAFDTDERS